MGRIERNQNGLIKLTWNQIKTQMCLNDAWKLSGEQLGLNGQPAQLCFSGGGNLLTENWLETECHIGSMRKSLEIKEATLRSLIIQNKKIYYSNLQNIQFSKSVTYFST